MRCLNQQRLWKTPEEKHGKTNGKKYPDWKNNSDQTYSCPETLASLGIMGDKIEGPTLSRTSAHYRIEGFKSGPYLASTIA